MRRLARSRRHVDPAFITTRPASICIQFAFFFSKKDSYYGKVARIDGATTISKMTRHCKTHLTVVRQAKTL
jgi:hypothetical protein